MSLTSAQAAKTISKVVALANTDSAFKSSLLSNPNAALASHGLILPPDVNLHFVDAGAPMPTSTGTDVYLQLGSLDRIGDVELNEEALTKVAGGGGSTHSTNSTSYTIASCVTCSATGSTKCTT
ncbi:MAG: hypothetical protein J0I17_00880 ['Candidatus Kapabacteria' thiocyanatum]|uniref:Nitrile hydratase alpha /Thiocyanate hydrolase gamma domain-containing protein n=1 Tax=Candidatus Kapaibacterium thiocyanatum TaxID=1895771 RepID=A0A1M3KWJ9_9BACT|nr:hypothetical protein ['Candidatus Kapabacteria' thiocyanatum]OJX56743.1 MAG: hypothetical protein BGO89_09405 ['Candidatus Kapabacteria' thiocyanatum]